MDNQVPPRGTLNVDHVAHFVPDVEAAGTALAELGFVVTPFSAQSHRRKPGGPLVPAGTGNRCVMLEAGYLEFLTPTADTPIANELRKAIERHVGVHLIAFGTAAPAADHERLARAGFEPLPPVALQRSIDTVAGADIARFTVVRVPPGTMAEGRIQFCQHHTPHLLWQPRWTEHPNRARALAGVLLCVEDPRAVAERYSRFTGLPARAGAASWRLDTGRGFLLFMERERWRREFGVEPPSLPWIGGYVLASDDLAATIAFLRNTGYGGDMLDNETALVRLAPALGGIALFVSPARGALPV